MSLKLKQFECWVDRPDGSRYLVQEVPSQKQAEISTRANGIMVAYVREAYLYQIREWSGVTDEDGNAVPFSQENLRLAIENDLGALNDVLEAFQKLREAYIEKVRGVRKN